VLGVLRLILSFWVIGVDGIWVCIRCGLLVWFKVGLVVDMYGIRVSEV
jgi:hypothetical protein